MRGPPCAVINFRSCSTKVNSIDLMLMNRGARIKLQSDGEELPGLVSREGKESSVLWIRESTEIGRSLADRDS